MNAYFNDVHEAASWLDEIDQQLERKLGDARESLDPSRNRARGLCEVAEIVIDEKLDSDSQIAFLQGLANLAQAQWINFPGNLFWDFEYLAMSVVRCANQQTGGRSEYVRQHFEQIIALQALFGRSGKIRFRYVHDFVYGFDWSRWVQARPGLRQHIGPFDREFLCALEKRGHELLQRIAANDLKYPRLPENVFRNPFGFSREPAQERQLHREMVQRSAIPVRAWMFDAKPDWRSESSKIRANLARQLWG